MRNNIFFLLFTLALFSCKKDIPPVKENPTFIAGNRDILISTEGTYNFGNAGISLYSPSSGTVIEDVFKSNNNNQALGDVCQSLCINGNKIYAVLNNSGKIIVLDKSNFQKTGEINSLSSPRYMKIISNNKAYVTNYYAGYISVIDLSSNTQTSTIPCNGWTEEMESSYGRVFVTNTQKEYVYVIETATDQKIDSIWVGYGSCSIVKDQNEKLWVAYTGKQSLGQYPGIARINTITNTVELNMLFSTYTDSPWRLKTDGNNIFYLNNGVHKFNITSTTLPNTPIIAQGNRNFYGLGVDPTTNEIYVADAIDYVQKGKILRHDANGILSSSFNVGIIPNEFYFN